jgi:hypothetical protein
MTKTYEEKLKAVALRNYWVDVKMYEDWGKKIIARPHSIYNDYLLYLWFSEFFDYIYKSKEESNHNMRYVYSQEAENEFKRIQLYLEKGLKNAS